MKPSLWRAIRHRVENVYLSGRVKFQGESLDFVYDGPAYSRGRMSSKRRRFKRRGVDPGFVLIAGIAIGTALVLLLVSWWR